MPLIQQYINKLNLISTKRKAILKKKKKRERHSSILYSKKNKSKVKIGIPCFQMISGEEVATETERRFVRGGVF